MIYFENNKGDDIVMTDRELIAYLRVMACLIEAKAKSAEDAVAIIKDQIDYMKNLLESTENEND